MTRARKFLMFAPIGIAAMTLFVFVGGELVKVLWNWLLPGLFGFPVLTFWQALGLLALCRILFGGFRLSGSRHGRRWERMSPEDRELIRERIREKFGRDPVGAPRGQ